MSLTVQQRWQQLTIIAQDPSVRTGGKIVVAKASVPAERLASGPWGHLIQVVDIDATSHCLYEPLRYNRSPDGTVVDRFAGRKGEDLIRNPQFHAQNACAIAIVLTDPHSRPVPVPTRARHRRYAICERHQKW